MKYEAACKTPASINSGDGFVTVKNYVSSAIDLKIITGYGYISSRALMLCQVIMLLFRGVLSAWLDGRLWKLEAVGSNPTTPTNKYVLASLF